MRRSGRKKKKNRLKIIAVIFIFLILAAIGLLVFITHQITGNGVEIVDQEEVDPTADEVLIGKEVQQDDQVFNVLLVGTDSRDPDADMGRSDSMMLLSFNQREGKATAVSFLRDCLVDIEGHGKSRLGHTYAYGGVGLTINTLNQVFGLDIQKYITINFDNLVNVIDELGGIEVTLTEEEAEYYRSNGMPDIQAGKVTLTGSQALVHARNRSLDSDFGRTRRQRDVMYGVYQKVLEKRDPATLMSLINYCVTQVNTNMSVGEIYETATAVLAVDNLQAQQAVVPMDGSYSSINYEGMAVLDIDVEANSQHIHELLY